MFISRDLRDLQPAVEKRARQHIAACRAAGIDVIVTTTLRTREQQQAIYDRGRFGDIGRIVTNDHPDDSLSLMGCAYTMVPLIFGRPLCTSVGWDKIVWMRVGELGEGCGLTWEARSSTGFAKYELFYYTGGLTRADILGGRVPE